MENIIAQIRHPRTPNDLAAQYVIADRRIDVLVWRLCGARARHALPQMWRLRDAMTRLHGVILDEDYTLYDAVMSASSRGWRTPEPSLQEPLTAADVAGVLELLDETRDAFVHLAVGVRDPQIAGAALTARREARELAESITTAQ